MTATTATTSPAPPPTTTSIQQQQQRTFAGSKRRLRQHDVLARKVSDADPFRVGQDDVAQIPLVGQMSMSDGDAERQYLADRLGVYDVVLGVVVRVRRMLLLLLGCGGGGRRLGCRRVGRRGADQVDVDVVFVVLEVMIETVWSSSTSRTSTNERHIEQ